MSFYVFISDAVFCVKFFHIGEQSLANIVILICSIFLNYYNATGLAIVARAILRWIVFVSKKLSQNGSFH